MTKSKPMGQTATAGAAHPKSEPVEENNVASSARMRTGVAISRANRSISASHSEQGRRCGKDTSTHIELRIEVGRIRLG
jgi:hypothetical protein